MKIKTSELTGPALRIAVAMCEGIELIRAAGLLHIREDFRNLDIVPTWAPDEDWAQGGPIIERIAGYCMEDEGPECEDPTTRYYCSTSSVAEEWHNHPVSATGPTPLIAAMRCYVASRLGGEVDIPEGLL